MTHCFLLKGEDPPQCIACDCELTIKHILFECVDFIESRKRHFNVDTFKELFEKVEIHPQLGLWPGGSRIIRHEESVLARIRIGHTHLTHCFLLKGEDPPQCIACDCELTIKHILFECVDFIESRKRHFNVDTFKELFEKVPPDSILSYLHEIGLFYRL